MHLVQDRACVCKDLSKVGSTDGIFGNVPFTYFLNLSYLSYPIRSYKADKKNLQLPDPFDIPAHLG